jgi:hypothetical protein
VGVTVGDAVAVGVGVTVGVLVGVGVNVGACKSLNWKMLLLPWPLMFSVMHNGYPGVFDWLPAGSAVAFSGTDWPRGPTAVGSSQTVYVEAVSPADWALPLPLPPSVTVSWNSGVPPGVAPA